MGKHQKCKCECPDPLDGCEFDMQVYPTKRRKHRCKCHGIDLCGRVVVVTGTSRGIGRAIARRLKQKFGCIVIGSSRGG